MLDFSNINEDISQVFGGGAPERIHNLITEEYNLLSAIVNAIHSYSSNYLLYQKNQVAPSTGDVTDVTDADPQLRAITRLGINNAKRSITLAYNKILDIANQFSSLLEKRQSFVGDVFFSFTRGGCPISCNFATGTDFDAGLVYITPKLAYDARSWKSCYFPTCVRIADITAVQHHWYAGNPIVQTFGGKVMQCTIADGVRGKRWDVIATVGNESVSASHFRVFIYCTTSKGTSCAYFQTKVNSLGRMEKMVPYAWNSMGVAIDIHNTYDLSDLLTECPIKEIFLDEDTLDTLEKGTMTPRTVLWSHDTAPYGPMEPQLTIPIVVDSLSSHPAMDGISAGDGIVLSGYLGYHDPVSPVVDTFKFGPYLAAHNCSYQHPVGTFQANPTFTGLNDDTMTYTPMSLEDDVSVVSAADFRDTILPENFKVLVNDFIQLPG